MKNILKYILMSIDAFVLLRKDDNEICQYHNIFFFINITKNHIFQMPTIVDTPSLPEL